MLIDSHCHLHDQQFFTPDQAEEMIKRAHENNVQRIICIGTDPEDSLAARDFAAKHDAVYWTYGVHPEEATREKTTLSKSIFSDVENTERPSPVTTGARERSEKGFFSRLVAIGEVGLDYHYEGYNREAQIKLFEEMLQLANDYDLPVSFHVREAFDDFFPVVANFPKTRGVVHSFSDNKKKLKRILNETDFYVGVNGMATYSTLPTPPLERILLETDAPFLTPNPFRGIINEPAYIPAIAEWLAEKLGEDLDVIEKETTKNAEKLFRFSGSDLRKTRSV